MKLRPFLICTFLLIVIQLAAREDWDGRIYLATYPRSGNHWMRYLVEEATLVMTSSVYPDKEPPHSPFPYPWGGFAPNHGYRGNVRPPTEHEPFLLKTHYPALSPRAFDLKAHKKVVRIVRHPIDSIYSWHIFKQKEDITEIKVPKERFEWMVKMYAQFERYWDKQPNVLTVRYEDMLVDPEFILRKVLKFCGYRCTKEDIKRAVVLNPPRGIVLKHLEHFSAVQREFIRSELAEFLEKYGYEVPF